MKTYYPLLLLLLLSPHLIAQNTEQTSETFYREDQIYLGISHTLMLHADKEYATNGVSPSIDLGIIRDVPLNTTCTQAIGLGVGFRYQNLRNNLIFEEQNNQITINNDYTTNRLRSWYLEVPIEYRWRTSTPTSYKFWRVYTGLKYSYALSNHYYHNGSFGNYDQSVQSSINRHQIQTYLSVGYNAWNFRFGLQLTPFLNQNNTNNIQKFYPIDLGIIFYIL